MLYLASAPHMFGDFFNQGGQIRVNPGRPANVTGVADLPVAGGARRIKISENNSALPMDRVYLMYNHFHNALEADLNPSRPGFTRDFSVDRYVIGLEKTFCQGLWSVDLRMPFTNQYGLSAPGFAVDGGNVGNLGIALKRALAASDTMVLAAGLGIDTPTGSDIDAQVDTLRVTLRNDSVQLLPFAGALGVPSDRVFYHGFVQLDVPTGGNRVDYVETSAGAAGSCGRLTDQTLLYLDAGAGYWLYRNPCSCGLTGVASVLEFHYTTTLEDADLVRDPTELVVIGNSLNRLDVMDVTVGLHAELANRTALRVAGVLPLRDHPDKPFDAEVQISVNRRF
jgi:hypothetical protein